MKNKTGSRKATYIKQALKMLLGYLSIVFLASSLPFALSNPEVNNPWLMIVLAIPNMIVIAWFMGEAMNPKADHQTGELKATIQPPVGQTPPKLPRFIISNDVSEGSSKTKYPRLPVLSKMTPFSIDREVALDDVKFDSLIDDPSLRSRRNLKH